MYTCVCLCVSWTECDLTGIKCVTVSWVVRKDVGDEEVAVTKAGRMLSAGFLNNKLLTTVSLSCENI